MPRDKLSTELYEVLHKATVEDEVLEQKQDAATLVKDLRLGSNDFIWIAGRLTDLSIGHGGIPIFTSEVEACDTVGDLDKAYHEAAQTPAAALVAALISEQRRKGAGR